uniref:Uncharacterized protein n=1 Tax=Romanomermis culicivorax TaxID=13658 RepID=A0A915HKA0_ROMCU
RLPNQRRFVVVVIFIIKRSPRRPQFRRSTAAVDVDVGCGCGEFRPSVLPSTAAATAAAAAGFLVRPKSRASNVGGKRRGRRRTSRYAGTKSVVILPTNDSVGDSADYSVVDGRPTERKNVDVEFEFLRVARAKFIRRIAKFWRKFNDNKEGKEENKK